MNRFLLAVALAGTTLAGIAAAQPQPQPVAADRAQRGSAALDLNRDGVITRAEVIQAADARFAALDKNRDGTVSAGERPNMRGGDVTRDQLRQRMTARFDRADANKDGRIDQRERAGLHGRGGKRMAEGGRRGGPAMRGGGGHMLMMADTNRDGVITKAEAVAATQTMFDRIDTNRDGRIDQAERGAVTDRMKQRRGADPAAADTRL